VGHTKFNIFTEFDAVAVTGTNTYHSPVSEVSQQHNIGLDITFTGTMIGTLTVEGCNAQEGKPQVFKALTFNPALSQPSGSNLSYLVNVNQFPFRYFRVSYVNSSGSGTLSIVMTSKDLS
jgi:hypothetical protein